MRQAFLDFLKRIGRLPWAFMCSVCRQVLKWRMSGSLPATQAEIDLGVRNLTQQVPHPVPHLHSAHTIQPRKLKVSSFFHPSRPLDPGSLGRLVTRFLTLISPTTDCRAAEPRLSPCNYARSLVQSSGPTAAHSLNCL